MTERNVTVQVGPGFPALLFITFLVLKLTEVIDWSWWWVTAPLWIPIGIVLAVFACALIFFLIVAGIAALTGKKIIKKNFKHIRR